MNSGYAVTPWKINMEPTNHPFRKENDLPNLHDCFHVNLQGCIPCFFFVSHIFQRSSTYLPNEDFTRAPWDDGKFEVSTGEMMLVMGEQEVTLSMLGEKTLDENGRLEGLYRRHLEFQKDAN